MCLLGTFAGACTRQSPPIPGHICPSTTLSPGLVPGTVRAGPVFFVSGPEDCQAHAYTYDGARTDRRLILPSCVEVCSAGPRIAPDGSVFDLTDQPGELPSATWAPDSRKICGLPQGPVRPIRVGWYALNAPHNVHATTYPGLFRGDRSGRYALASCDPRAGTATLVADNTTGSVDALAVVDLTRPTALWQKRFSQPPAGPISVVAGSDARYLAVQYTRRPPTPAWSPAPIHCTSGRVCGVPLPPQTPPPVPTRADLYALRPTPHIIGRVIGQRVVGWSGDGSRVVVWSSHGPSGIGDTVGVVSARDGHLIWRTAGSYGVSISAPGLSALVIQTSQPKGEATIDLIDPAGRARRLDVHGSLIPIR
jgi:hypothetical protein